MTADLIKRLEAAYKSSMPVGDLWNLCAEAADELERLTSQAPAEGEREAFEEFVSEGGKFPACARRCVDGEYQNPFSQTSRRAWCAALSWQARTASNVQPKGPPMLAPAQRAQLVLSEDQVGQLIYEGNTVSYLKQRASSYGDELMACWGVLREAGLAGESGQKLHEALRAAIQSPAPAPEPVGKMTAQRAKFFLQRFKREEKLLGPNEQAGLDYAIAALEREQYAPATPAPAVGPRYRFWVGDGEAAMLPAADGNWVRYNGWQPIKTAPKDGTHILAWTDASDTAYVICWADADKGIRRELTNESGAQLGWHLAWDGELFDGPFEPTHWMPLPDGPESDAPVQPMGDSNG